ncbi:hypothetical protein GC163_23600 [bacterium]|nr:hypothetical protein [bacterium]
MRFPTDYSFLNSTKRFVCLSLCLLPLWTGCGSAPNEVVLAPVLGHVTLKGSPVSGALVQFSPTTGPSSMGYTDETGAYVLKLNDQSGAVPASHTVKVTLGLPAPASDTGAGGEIPQEQSLTAKPPTDYIFATPVTVNTGENTFDLDLDKAQKKQG